MLPSLESTPGSRTHGPATPSHAGVFMGGAGQTGYDPDTLQARLVSMLAW